MSVLSMANTRRSLARGFARQAMTQAALENADTIRILTELCGMAPNDRSRKRFAARLRSRRGVVSARAAKDGLVLVLRSVLTVDVRKEGIACFSEERIAWTRVHFRCGKGMISFRLDAIHATHHVIQRRVERSDCSTVDLLGDMDAEMQRALACLIDGRILTDRDDDYLPTRHGVWAGGIEETCMDPTWDTTFRQNAPLQIFAIRTYLGEEEMRPTVWLGWSESRPVVDASAA